jgi:hypothetical protein
MSCSKVKVFRHSFQDQRLAKNRLRATTENGNLVSFREDVYISHPEVSLALQFQELEIRLFKAVKPKTFLAT